MSSVLQSFNAVNREPSVDDVAAFLAAAKDGDVNTLTHLVERYGDNIINGSDSDKNTALIWAAYKNQYDAYAVLVEHNANIEEKDTHGWTALMRALDNGRYKIALDLLDKGADAQVNVGHDGWTPLALAVRGSSVEAVTCLLDKGASANEKDSTGQTALMGAVLKNRPLIVEALLERGADLNAVDDKGVSVFLIAQANKRTSILDILEGWPEKQRLKEQKRLKGLADDIAQMREGGIRQSVQTQGRLVLKRPR